MPSKLETALTSKTFWIVLGIVAVNVLSAVLPYLQGTPQVVVSTALAVLAMYVHPGEVQNALATPPPQR